MPIYKKCPITYFYYSDDAGDDTECDVRIEGKRIVLDLPGDRLVYSGTEIGSGHYKLECKTNGGRGTLHRIPDDDILEGYWYEDGTLGMWRLQLIDD